MKAVLLAMLLANGRAGPVDFDRAVKPILAARCFSCHGPSKQRADLRLDLKDSAFKGGESGPALVAGKSAASLLYRRVTSQDAEERMPPSGAPLTAVEMDVLKAWIDQGAQWSAKSEVDPRKTHWAFQPVTRPAVPVSHWGRTPVDGFIAARLAKAGLKPSPEADRVTLIRRLKFDLLGLPPTPEEVAAFVRDPSSTAYENLVERYLASPHFGERWARHWLDVVRFAETTGFETNATRPNAWPYRDYVIRAINDDKPYDQFIRDQLAGDVQGEGEATGFLVGGAYDQVKGDPALNAQQRADELHDIISATGGAFLGLTVGCARCHDHKFDPVSQVDYHRLKAVFAGVFHDERPLTLARQTPRSGEIEAVRRELKSLEIRLAESEPLAGAGQKRAAVTARRNVERFAPTEAKFVRMTILATAQGAEPCVDELEVFAGERNVALAGPELRVTASGTLPGYDIHQLAFVNDGKFGNSRSWISNQRGRGWVQIELAKAKRIDRIVWSRDRLEGGYQDRVATVYRFEVAGKPGEWRVVASSDDRLAPGETSPASGDRASLIERQRLLEARLRPLTTPPHGCTPAVSPLRSRPIGCIAATSRRRARGSLPARLWSSARGSSLRIRRRNKNGASPWRVGLRTRNIR